MNKNHANTWLSQIREVAQQNFKIYGTEDDEDTFYYVNGEPVAKAEKKVSEKLEFEDPSANEYTLLLSGRENCFYTNMNLVLRRRHDFRDMLASTFFGSCLVVQKDRLWIDIPIKRVEPIKTEILLIQQRDLKAAKKAQEHIDIILS